MALDFAATKLQNLELINGETEEEIDRIQGRFDLIVAGYTIQHLDEKGKRALFVYLKERLYSGGLLVVYDVVHRQEEKRKEYLDRAVRHLETDWTIFTAEQLKSIRNHVRQADIPESWEGWRRIAQESGYDKIRFPYNDKNRLFGIGEFFD